MAARGSDQLALALEPERQALFRHPGHNREIRCGAHVVAYLLKRAPRRTIGFVIGEDGLVVSAPRWVGQPDIDVALQSKAAWIVRKLLDQADRRQRLDSARLEWRDGACLPYLGAPLQLLLGARLPRGTLAQLLAPAALLGVNDIDDIDDIDDGQTASLQRLHIGLPAEAEAAQIRATVQHWLQRQALLLFEARCRDYADRMGVRVARLRLSSAQTRWGSASANGTVRLNWRLIHFPLPTIDYVVVHELAHLREMNHSPAFWAIVRSVMPDFEARRSALKDGSVPLHD